MDYFSNEFITILSQKHSFIEINNHSLTYQNEFVNFNLSTPNNLTEPEILSILEKLDKSNLKTFISKFPDFTLNENIISTKYNFSYHIQNFNLKDIFQWIEKHSLIIQNIETNVLPLLKPLHFNIIGNPNGISIYINNFMFFLKINNNDFNEISYYKVNNICEQKVNLPLNKYNLRKCYNNAKLINLYLSKIIPIKDENEFYIFQCFISKNPLIEEILYLINIFNTIYTYIDFQKIYSYNQTIYLKNGCLSFGNNLYPTDKVIEFIELILHIYPDCRKCIIA